MSLPPVLLGAALLFWGWRSGNPVAGVLLALLIEAPHLVRARFDFRHADLTRVADLCGTLFAGMLVWQFAGQDGGTASRAVLSTLQWMPALLMPVLLAQLFSSSGRIPLSALFRYLRKARERDPSISDPPVDLGGVYFVICLVAAGISNRRDLLFYAGIVLLAAWALAPLRPKRSALATWLGLVALAASLGFGAQLAMVQAQAMLGDWVSDWFMRGLAPDPYRSTTDLGTVGRLKMIDAIVLRVYAREEDAERIKLLHRASFSSLTGTTWVARNAPLAAIEPQADGTTWLLAEGEPSARVRIVTRLEGGKALLALPAGTRRVSALPAISMRRNAFGATQIDLGGDWSPYVAESAAGIEDYAPARAEDVALPQAEREAFARLAAVLGLHGRPAAEIVERVRAHLAGFSYSTYREAAVPEGASALGDFLTRSKSGHCEYFAAAATLLLRAAGVPARYATGFAMVEYSKLEEAYVVRARHAHAWTRAFIDGRWIDLDTTPPSWFDAEEREAPAWEGIADFLRWAGFRWSQRGPMELGPVWYAAFAFVLAIIAWRFTRGRRAALPGAASGATRAFRGADSEFYALERTLARRGLARPPQQTIGAWTALVLPALDVEQRRQFARAALLHRRYRFDPPGLSLAERAELRSACLAVGEALH